MQKSKQKCLCNQKPKEQEVFGRDFDCEECLCAEFMDGYEMGIEDAEDGAKTIMAQGLIFGGLIVGIAWIISII